MVTPNGFTADTVVVGPNTAFDMKTLVIGKATKVVGVYVVSGQTTIVDPGTSLVVRSLANGQNWEWELMRHSGITLPPMNMVVQTNMPGTAHVYQLG